MNKDRIEGNVKDIAGRMERKAGELTDNPKTQIKGGAKQVEGKIQNAVGQAKDAAKRADDDVASAKPPRRAVDENDTETEESEGELGNSRR
jgi:uncharacterized protein YjbJ (UPF0337 family)